MLPLATTTTTVNAAAEVNRWSFILSPLSERTVCRGVRWVVVRCNVNMSDLRHFGAHGKTSSNINNV